MPEKDLTREEYRELAEFRRQIRKFLHFSEAVAKEHGIEAQQHQLLLAVQGLPEGVKPTIREIASRMFLQHHSAVELLNRLEQTGAIARHSGREDKRVQSAECCRKRPQFPSDTVDKQIDRFFGPRVTAGM